MLPRNPHKVQPMTDEDYTEMIAQTYLKFCAVMGMDSQKWNTVFEFAMMVGRSDILADNVPMPTVRLIKTYYGTHGSTLIQAYKIRRYSPWGRVGSVLKKFTIYAKFATTCLRDLRSTWQSL